MIKMKLTPQQKIEFIERDYCVGRLHSMEYIMDTYAYLEDTTLQEMFNILLNYDNFGDGDEFENEKWFEIIDYLDLQQSYDTLWNKLEEKWSK